MLKRTVHESAAAGTEAGRALFSSTTRKTCAPRTAASPTTCPMGMQGKRNQQRQWTKFGKSNTCPRSLSVQ